LGARHLQRTLQENSSEGISCCFLCDDPDLNILCYSFQAQQGDRNVPIAVINRAIDRLYEELLPTASAPPHTKPFVVAKTSLEVDEYGDRAQAVLDQFGIGGRIADCDEVDNSANPWRDDDRINLVRTVVMGPFLLSAEAGRPLGDDRRDLAREYAEFVHRRVADIIAEIQSEPLPPERRPELNECIMIVEDDLATSNMLEREVRTSFSMGPEAKVLCLDNLGEAMDRVSERDVSAALVDIKLQDANEGGIQFLEAVAEQRRTGFKGAVVFSAIPNGQIRTALNNIANANRWQINTHVKPDLNSDNQLALNRLMEDLWDILHT
jgi:ActR/RegA family two-component response regulator